MGIAIELAFIGGSIILYVMVLSAMLDGAWRRYPVIFGYVAFNLFSTVTQASFKHYYGATSKAFARAYWISDFIATILILLIIVHLIRIAMERHPLRNPVCVGLLLGVVATGAISGFLVQNRSLDPLRSKLMTEVGRDYYFSAVLLVVVLWVMLIRTNQENKQLYLFTSGLGLQLTGAAIAHAIRMSSHMWLLANCFLAATYLLNLYIWYVAVKKFPAEAPLRNAVPEKLPLTEKSKLIP
jgi:hypothetical protein